MPVFLYGPLRYAPLLNFVLGSGAKLSLEPARLEGAAVHWAANGRGLLLVEDPEAAVEGLLLGEGGDPERVKRLDYYGAVQGYRRHRVAVGTAGGTVEADVHVPPEGDWKVGPPWVLEDWTEVHGARALREADEVIERMGRDSPEVAGRMSGSASARADAWCRARDTVVPAVRRSGLSAEDVATEARRRPYRQFFMVEEQDLRFRRFDGTLSAPVTRAAFVMGDAVTVLPYDPVRDRVLMVEQFRFGAHARGDRHPWTLEAIAGRIDAGESPEDAARRETREEAGLTLSGLEPVARYYPSPGAITEYLYSFVGLADLPDGVAQTGGGLDTEDEDIRAVLMEFDDIPAFLAGGEAENGPLVMSLQWLMLHRDRLRGA